MVYKNRLQPESGWTEADRVYLVTDTQEPTESWKDGENEEEEEEETGIIEEGCAPNGTVFPT